MTPRSLGASLGVLVALITVYFIVSRLFEAAAPQPTPISLSNLGASSIGVDGLFVAGERVSSLALTLPPLGADGGTSESVVDAHLEPGRPVELKARLLAPNPAEASCRLEARPYGVCRIKARFNAAASLLCEYECKSQSAK